MHNRRFQFLGSAFYFGKKAGLFETNEQKLTLKGQDLEIWIVLMYQKICRNPEVAMDLIGMSLAEFERLYNEFEIAYRAHENTRRDELKRRRAVGGGRKHRYSLRDRLLMTLFWLKAHTTYKVLGTLYGLDKTTVEDYLKTVINVLQTMPGFHFERPQPEVPKLRSMHEVTNAFPSLLPIMDSKNQYNEFSVP